MLMQLEKLKHLFNTQIVMVWTLELVRCVTKGLCGVSCI